jgi:hypothetical protein
MRIQKGQKHTDPEHCYTLIDFCEQDLSGCDETFLAAHKWVLANLEIHIDAAHKNLGIISSTSEPTRSRSGSIECHEETCEIRQQISLITCFRINQEEKWELQKKSSLFKKSAALL